MEVSIIMSDFLLYVEWCAFNKLQEKYVVLPYVADFSIKGTVFPPLGKLKRVFV
jgi:hypothetical protein